MALNIHRQMWWIAPPAVPSLIHLCRKATVIAAEWSWHQQKWPQDSDEKAAERGNWSLLCSLRPFVNEGNSRHFGPDTLQIFQCKENGTSLGVGSHKCLAEPVDQEYWLSNLPYVQKDGNLNWGKLYPHQSIGRLGLFYGLEHCYWKSFHCAQQQSQWEWHIF